MGDVAGESHRIRSPGVQDHGELSAVSRYQTRLPFHQPASSDASLVKRFHSRSSFRSDVAAVRRAGHPDGIPFDVPQRSYPHHDRNAPKGLHAYGRVV